LQRASKESRPPLRSSQSITARPEAPQAIPTLTPGYSRSKHSRALSGSRIAQTLV
jgi:hypothetical protein